MFRKTLHTIVLLLTVIISDGTIGEELASPEVACPSESYWLKTETDFDNFPDSCDHIVGDLVVNAFPTPVDFKVFQNIVQVGGLYIYENGQSVVNLDGLENLHTVVNQVTLGWNSQLNDISGLSGLRYVSKLHIVGNKVLSDVSVLSGLTHIDEN